MAKKKTSPAAEAKKQAAMDRKLEAQKIKDMQDNAFRKVQHIAMRAAARQAGYQAGMRAAGIQMKPTKGKLKKR